MSIDHSNIAALCQAQANTSQQVPKALPAIVSSESSSQNAKKKSTEIRRRSVLSFEACPHVVMDEYFRNEFPTLFDNEDE
jgi:hypothetical protein